MVKQLKEQSVEFDSINYYEESFSVDSLKDICRKLGISPREMLRTKEPTYKALRLAERRFSEDELIAVMVKYPDLIQRPIIVKGKKAVLARPAEKLKEIL